MIVILDLLGLGLVAYVIYRVVGTLERWERERIFREAKKAGRKKGDSTDRS